MAKRLVVCLDGTWNSPDNGSPTNVAKIMRAVAPVDDQGIAQITFYDAGVGADSGGVARLIDGATGRGLEQNVRDGYRFLAHNWLPGDEIYVFGFSRGAFSARSLCGLIDAVGLLPRRDMDRLDEAWQLYQTPKGQRDEKRRRALRALRPGQVRVQCLGVWDTVGALGVPGQLLQSMNRKHRFHDVQLPQLVECAFQALAIDEKRGPFGPVLWEAPLSGGQHIEQVWFPGDHGNVGGGRPDSRLSDLALTWMIGRVEAHSKLAFDEGYIGDRDKVDPDPFAEVVESRSLIYWSSWLLPFQRLIGQAPVMRSWLRRFFPRTNRSENGRAFANEMIHWSAAQRFGRMARQDGRLRRYQPETLGVALAKGVPIATDRILDPISPPMLQPALP